ncbi:MAG: hypothetical protein R3C42_08190 [Parvularculaceae bacterium]
MQTIAESTFHASERSHRKGALDPSPVAPAAAPIMFGELLVGLVSIKGAALFQMQRGAVGAGSFEGAYSMRSFILHSPGHSGARAARTRNPSSPMFPGSSAFALLFVNRPDE